MTATGPSTDGSGSLLAAATTAIAAGASTIAAAASALPDRVDSDLRISMPTKLGRNGPVRRTAGRTGAGVGRVMVAVMSVSSEEVKGGWSAGSVMTPPP